MAGVLVTMVVVFVILILLFFGGAFIAALVSPDKNVDQGEIERQQGSTGNYDTVRVRVLADDLWVLGAHYAGSKDSIYVNLICRTNGLLHLANRVSVHDLKLLEIKYTPLYDSQTVTEGRGGVGSAIVGGLVAGPVGAVVGGVAGHKSSTTTSNQSTESWAHLIVRKKDQARRHTLRVAMNDELYKKLSKYVSPEF